MLQKNGFIIRKISKSYKVNQSLNLIYSFLSKNYILKRNIRNLLIKKYLEFPERIEIELTNFCNARCVKCSNSIMERKKGLMDIELIRKITDDLEHNNIKSIHFSGYGEPLLHPKFPEIINEIKIKKPDINIELFTNAEVLTPDKAEEILRSGIDRINISFDGTTKETYEKNTGMNFEKTQSNIKNLLNLKRNFNLKRPIVNLYLNELYINTQEEKILEFRKQWVGLADNISIQSYDLWGGGVEDKINKRKSLSLQRPCLRLWTLMVIRWNGDVSLCNVDYDNMISLGNVKERSIKDIWNGERIRQIRQTHIDNRFSEIPICNKCSYRPDLPSWWW